MQYLNALWKYDTCFLPAFWEGLDAELSDTV